MLNVRHISTSGLFALESIPHASTDTSVIPTKFEVDMTIHCRVFVCRYVTWPCGIDLWPWIICLTWRATCPTLPPSLMTLRLFVHELRVITVPVDYHWKCVRGNCACAESCDPWVEGQKRLHFWNPRLRFVYSLYNFYWATTTIKGRLLSSRPMLCRFRAKRNPVPFKWAPKTAVFGKWVSKP